MSIDKFFLEDTRPAIVPNAGHHVSVHWTDADRRLFGERMRRKFPNVLFFEEFEHSDASNENFRPRFVENLDESRPRQTVDAVFPSPQWKPEIVLAPDARLPHWTWKNYLSPIISIMSRPHPGDQSQREDWKGDAADMPIQVWRGINIRTSYRRELDGERKIQAAVLRLAASLSRQLVPVRWRSYADYCSRVGSVAGRWLRTERNFASQSVIEWARTEPRREIDLSVWPCEHVGVTWHAPEDIPEAWWGDIPKPKWAQR